MIQAIVDFFKSLWNKLTGHKAPDTGVSTTPTGVGGGGGGSRPSDTKTEQV